MDAIKQLFNSPEHVKNYDEKTKRSNWLGPEILFGLSFKHLKPGEKILDLGIGTGLISELFYKAGLQVYGMDFSSEMLKACAGKNVAVELKKHDLQEIPYPYETDSMDNAVCGGVMHIFKDISPIFQEASRIVKTGGTFAFACHNSSAGKSCNNTSVYNHDQAEVETLLNVHGFELLSSLDFFVFMQGDKKQKRFFRAYVGRKVNIE